jgi:hypothetical protein
MTFTFGRSRWSVIGMINTSQDLNCVTLNVSETLSGPAFTNIVGTHSGKVLKVKLT